MLWVVLPLLQDVLPLRRSPSTGVEGTGRLELRGTGDIVVEDIGQVVVVLGNPLRGTGWQCKVQRIGSQKADEQLLLRLVAVTR